MSRRRYIKQIIAIFVAFLMIITMLAPALGDNAGSILYKYVISDSEFKLYYVGDVNSSVYTLCDELSDYDVDMEAKTAASTLASIVEYENLEPVATGVTGEDHNVSFNNLSKGVYLLAGEEKTVGDQKYIPEPVLVQLPSWVDKNLTWNMEVQGKYEEKTVVTYTSLSAVKVWKNDNAKSRPDSIKVALLQDGKTYKEATLDESNNWKVEWSKLDDLHTYKVIEENIPTGYTMSIDKNSTTYTITNTANTEETPETPSKLPQTGQLWWPVGILATAGLLCVLIGLIRRKKYED